MTLAVCVLAVLLGPVQGGVLPQLKAAGSLQLCADPQNLPFASQDPQQPGFEVELAREVARELGLKAEMVWIRTEGGRAALRQLLENRCDLFMGLPHDKRFLEENPRLTLSQPYYTMAHVLVLPESTGMREAQELAGKPVAVEFGSLGEFFAFQQGYTRQTYRKQEQLFQAVAGGEAAAAIMWAPIAGWMAHTHPEANLRLAELQSSDLAFPISIGMRKTDADLKEAVDGALLRLSQRHAVTDVLKRYGVPSASQISAQAASGQAATAPTHAGEGLYKKSCVECHGGNARGNALAPNLLMYKGTDEDFVKVVLNGRPTTAMAPFKGLLTEEEVRQIRTYIRGLPQ
jgi:ABC-type amino acid transport substrate-binding protein